VWAAGVMAYQLLSGRFPFDDWAHPEAPALSLVGGGGGGGGGGGKERGGGRGADRWAGGSVLHCNHAMVPNCY